MPNCKFQSRNNDSRKIAANAVLRLSCFCTVQRESERIGFIACGSECRRFESVRAPQEAKSCNPRDYGIFTFSEHEILMEHWWNIFKLFHQLWSWNLIGIQIQSELFSKSDRLRSDTCRQLLLTTPIDNFTDTPFGNYSCSNSRQ